MALLRIDPHQTVSAREKSGEASSRTRKRLLPLTLGLGK